MSINRPLLALFLIISLSLSMGDELIKPSIVGGNNASDGEYPWMAALINVTGQTPTTERQFCGGVLVAPNWILTAAHCVDLFGTPGFEILVGQTDLEASYVPVFPKSIHIHPSYQSRRVGRGADLALIEISPAIEDIEPVKINWALERLVPDRPVTAIGFGLTDYESEEDTSLLQEIDLSVREIDGFENNHPIYDYFFSAESDLATKGINSGDSGSPAIMRNEDGDDWLLVGVSSHSIRSIENEINHSYFTNIASVKDWIDRVLGSTDTHPPKPAVEKRIKVFQLESGSTRAGYRIWPFAGARTESIGFVHPVWKDQSNLTADFPPASYVGFEFGETDTYRANGDGSFYILDPFTDLEHPQPDPSLARIKIEAERIFERPFFKLRPFEIIRLTNKVGPYSASALLGPHRVGFEYRFCYTGFLNVRLLKQETKDGSTSPYSDALYTASDSTLYWADFGPLHSPTTVGLLPTTKKTISSGQTIQGVLSLDSHPYRNPLTRIELIKPDELPETSETKLTLLPTFDGEIAVFDTDFGYLVAYGDQGAENELDVLIVATDDLRNGLIGITNFDKDATGTFQLTMEEHISQNLQFDVLQQRGITPADEYSITTDNRRIPYETLTLRNVLGYEFITFEVEGLFFQPGVAIYSSNGTRLEFEYGKTFQEITIESSTNARYEIDVINFDETRVENYEIKVTGSNTDPR